MVDIDGNNSLDPANPANLAEMMKQLKALLARRAGGANPFKIDPNNKDRFDPAPSNPKAKKSNDSVAESKLQQVIRILQQVAQANLSNLSPSHIARVAKWGYIVVLLTDAMQLIQEALEASAEGGAVHSNASSLKASTGQAHNESIEFSKEANEGIKADQKEEKDPTSLTSTK